MAIGSYIPEYAGMAEEYKKMADYYQKQTEDTMTRSALRGRYRTSAILPEAIGKQRTEYSLGMNNQLSNIALQEAGLAREERMTAQSAREQEAMMFGGQSAYGGGALKGQYPWQSEMQTNQFKENELQRAWQRKLAEDQWNAQIKMSEEQANKGFLGSLFGGIGSILGGVAGSIFSPINALIGNQNNQNKK